MERLLPRFRAAHTQVLGVSIDSVYCHANWAKDLGGVSFPLLSDFHPKGAVARSYGLYLEDAGITDRATVIIDSGGTVRYVASVTPSGQRDILELAELCEGVDREHGRGLAPLPEPVGLEGEAVLYVKNNCALSQAALLARSNLHLEGRITVRNVSDDPAALEELKRGVGRDEAPGLVVGGKPVLGAPEIIRLLVERSTALPG